MRAAAYKWVREVERLRGEPDLWGLGAELQREPLHPPDSSAACGLQTFCQKYVEAMGEESDHVHIVALTDALQVGYEAASCVP
jgi:hypothetical protein